MMMDRVVEFPDGYLPFCTTDSKGHRFEIGIKPLPGRAYWRVAIVSLETVSYANAYNTDGVLRASASIADPPGHLLFRCDVVAGRPDPSRGFQSKFGRAGA